MTITVLAIANVTSIILFPSFFLFSFFFLFCSDMTITLLVNVLRLHYYIFMNVLIFVSVNVS